MKARDIHYVVRIGNAGTILYCDSWKKVILWLNSKLNENFCCGDDIRYYNECNNNLVSIEQHLYKSGDVKKFYKHRKNYVLKVRECEDSMTKAQRLPRSMRRDFLINLFVCAYDVANRLWEQHPEVWQGEI